MREKSFSWLYYSSLRRIYNFFFLLKINFCFTKRSGKFCLWLLASVLREISDKDVISQAPCYANQYFLVGQEMHCQLAEQWAHTTASLGSRVKCDSGASVGSCFHEGSPAEDFSSWRGLTNKLNGWKGLLTVPVTCHRSEVVRSGVSDSAAL